MNIRCWGLPRDGDSPGIGTSHDIVNRMLDADYVKISNDRRVRMNVNEAMSVKNN